MEKLMSKLGQVVESVEKYNKFVLDQVKRARTDQKFGRDLLGRWNDTKRKSRLRAHRPVCRCRVSRYRRSMSRARLRVSFSVKVCRASFLTSTLRIARCISSRFARLRVSEKERRTKTGKEDYAT